MVEFVEINSRRYKLPSRGEALALAIGDVGDLRLSDLPFPAIDLADLVPPLSHYRGNVSIRDEQDVIYISVHVSFLESATDSYSIAVCNRGFEQIRRAFKTLTEEGADGAESRCRFNDQWLCSTTYSLWLEKDNSHLSEFTIPVAQAFRQLATMRNRILAFICHASEDKNFVSRLVTFLDNNNVPIWYDLREIAVGQSIVARISDGLNAASHLIVVLSQASVTKSWVSKDLNAALMRQLSDDSVVVLPLRREPCEIPRMLIDLKYADCVVNEQAGFVEVIEAIQRSAHR